MKQTFTKFIDCLFISVFIALTTSQTANAQPAQIPLELAPAVEPNAMILLDTSGSMSRLTSLGVTRMDVAKTALHEIINESEHIRFCFSNFEEKEINGIETSSGAVLHYDNVAAGGKLCGSDQTHLDFLNSVIGNSGDPNSGVQPSGYTPLAEAYFDLSEAFAGDSAVFGSSILTDTSNVQLRTIIAEENIKSPIEYRCQSNNIIVVSDGEATFDWDDTTNDTWGTYTLPGGLERPAAGVTLPDYDGVDGLYGDFFEKPFDVAANSAEADQYRFKHPISDMSLDGNAGVNLSGEKAYLGVTPYPRFSDGWLGSDVALNATTAQPSRMDWIGESLHKDLEAIESGTTIYGSDEKREGPPFSKDFWNTLHSESTPSINCPPGNQPCIPDDDGSNPYFTPRIIDSASTDAKEPVTAQSARIYIDDLAKYGYDTDLRTSGDLETTELAGGSFDGENQDADGVNIEDADGNQITRYNKQALFTHTVGLDIGIAAADAGGTKVVRDLAGVQGLIDAAYYGGGQYHSASSDSTGSNTLKEALLQSILGITSGGGSGGGSAASNAYLRNNEAFIYRSGYNSDRWTGNIEKLKILEDEDDGTITFPEVWNALANMPVPTSRNIITHDYKPVAGELENTAFSFEWVGGGGAQYLTQNQFTALGGQNDHEHEAYINYIRGDHSNEGETTAFNFRERKRQNPGAASPKSPLGDVVHSSIIYVKDGDFGYPDEDYQAYVSAKVGTDAVDGRSAMVFVGANDGMLHAFNDDTGDEEFAFIPNTIFRNLKQLWRPSYLHRYFVDGKPIATDAKIGNNWKTIYASSLGAGGKGLFLLDISQPTQSYNNIFKWAVDPLVGYCTSKSRVIPLTSCPDSAENISGYEDLGYILSEPVIIRTKDGVDANGAVNEKWYLVTGNGVQSENGRAVLYLIDLENGRPHPIVLDNAVDGDGNALYDSLKNGNGITSLNVVDVDRDSYADLIYAGDLKGNIWRVDFSATSHAFETKFGSPASPDPLFTAQREVAAGDRATFGLSASDTHYPQPITGGITVSKGAAGSLMVFFGTGKYYDVEDLFPEQARRRQSFYAVSDSTPRGTAANEIDGPTIELDDLVNQAVSIDLDSGNRTFTSNEVNYASKKGWYLNLPHYGERILQKPTTLFDRIVFVSQSPNKHQAPTDFVPGDGTLANPSTDYCEVGARGQMMIADQQQGNPGFPLTASSTVGGVESTGGALSRPIIIQSEGKVNILNTQSSSESILVNQIDIQYRKTSWRILQ